MDPRQSVTLVDVRVEPAREAGTITGGGGICAGPDVPEWVSTLRDGVPVAARVEAGSAPATRLAGEYLWGGVTVQQPGHFVAEYAPRLLFSARGRPDCKVIFVLRKGAAPADLPGWFWDVLAWLGIDRSRIEFVGETPIVVERLTVFPQAEHLTVRLDHLDGTRQLDPTGVPSQQYLDALAENFADKGAEPIENDLVYVSRAGTTAPIGGEVYLEGLLRNAGVCVIRPEKLSIADQLRCFAGARHLIFAEGSSLHFRQLIGYRPQKITVLQRRPEQRIARGQLLSRADSLAYVNVVNGIVVGPFQKSTGIPARFAAFPHTDAAKLLAAFRGAGIDLDEVWDEEAFNEALEADLLEWAHHVRSISRKDALRYALNAQVSLTALGQPWEVAEEIARAIEPDRPLSRLQDVTPIERERDALLVQTDRLQRQLESIQSSASLKLGRALLSPAINLRKWRSRRTR